MNIDEPGISAAMYRAVQSLIFVTERIDSQDSFENNVNKPDLFRPTILIFLPGIYEIETLYKILENHVYV